MIVYSKNKSDFLDDMLSNEIEDIILCEIKKNLGRGVSPNEIRSWKNSLIYMDRILNTPEIPFNCNISIEYLIPLTSKRIDLIITGEDASNKPVVLIIELKQWERAESTLKDGVVKTYVGGGVREVSHPSYQSMSYASLIKDFNKTVQQKAIKIISCAYLHNYPEDSTLTSLFYLKYIEQSPIFFKQDAKKLRSFIIENITYGDSTNIIDQIDKSEIAPSKNLADKLSSLLKGNKEFTLIDDQKVVYETARQVAEHSVKNSTKRVVIIEGGPGTGKSVLAINLLVEFTRLLLNSRYITKNAAPREVYSTKLTKDFKRNQIKTMFTGSGSYTNTQSNEFDVLVIDEAHRLNEKSGLYQNLGSNQVKELIHSSHCSIFFIDENQKVTLNDIGSKDEILKWASYFSADTNQLKLESQFRCNGSDGFLAWLDNALQIHSTANKTLDGINYDFQVFSSPNELYDGIVRLNTNNNSRLVAGYCWPWSSKKDPSKDDIIFPNYNFSMKWNLTEDGSLWILKNSSINEVGCIHTCQGLEIEYIGVLIGPDLIVREGKVLTNPDARDKNDRSIRGYKKMHKKDPEETNKLMDQIIKNTYRTLMTRGSRGCYIFSDDEETREYFKSQLCH